MRTESRRSPIRALFVSLLVLVFTTRAEAAKCPPDAIQVGPACVDRFEASVWRIPNGKTSLVKKIQAGKATLADLTQAGATRLESQCSSTSPTFPANGNWTEPAYAVSLQGVTPTDCISWYAAEQACRLAGKRLPTNAEWQAAASGTPDPSVDDGTTTCNVLAAAAPAIAPTGSRSACVSRWATYDMVGNLSEWVADDWGDAANIQGEEPSAGCTTLPPDQGGDETCIGGDGTVHEPVAVVRGGDWHSGAKAGVFAFSRANQPIGRGNTIGFRCVR